MANFAFDSFRNQLWGTGTHIDFAADTIRIIFIDHTDDTPLVTDDFLDDFAGTSVPTTIASCPALATKTIGSLSVGTIDAEDTVFTSLTGDQVESLVMFKDITTTAASSTMLRWDTATGLPLTPNGANVTVAWNASGIATIS